MGSQSKIEWTTHTFNHVRGCAKVSAGCKNCYAETMSKRNPGTLGIWGTEAQGATRVVAADAMWKEPNKWNESAKEVIGPFKSQPSPSNQLKAGMSGTALFNHGDSFTGTIINTPTGLMVEPEKGSEFVGHFGVSCFTSFIPDRPRVFCASLADVFEDWQGPMVDSKGRQLFTVDGNEWFFMPEHPECRPRSRPKINRPLTMDDVRRRLFALIDATPNLDWLILTKRPENILKYRPSEQPFWAPRSGALVLSELESGSTTTADWVTRKNVWLGTSVENQETADQRIPELLKCRDLSRVLFLSCEPLLGPLDLRRWMSDLDVSRDALGNDLGSASGGSDIDWAIVGGESGPGARHCSISWFDSIRDQCKTAGVPCFIKQLGAKPMALVHPYGPCELELKHPKGGDWDEWPEELKVREFPSVGA